MSDARPAQSASPRFDPYEPEAPGGRRTRADLTAEALAAARDVADGSLESALEFARGHSGLGVPGTGATAGLWEDLAAVAAVDLTLARVLEPHLDAQAILAEAGHPVPRPGAWGVFAAEGAAPRLQAQLGPNGGWRLTGRKPWCSLARCLDHALVTAWTSATQRGLFAVDLTSPGVTTVPNTWQANGLPLVESGPVDFVDVPGEPVGEPGWYLARPGFAWGGMGVAACWWGGAVGIVRRMAAPSRGREPDQVAWLHLGAADAAVHAAGLTLAAAARAVDAGVADGTAGVALALRVRRTVRACADEVLQRAAHSLGPGPLALEREHAQRVADLELYVRQEHAERDEAALGRHLLADAPPSAWSP